MAHGSGRVSSSSSRDKRGFHETPGLHRAGDGSAAGGGALLLRGEAGEAAAGGGAGGPGAAPAAHAAASRRLAAEAQALVTARSGHHHHHSSRHSPHSSPQRKSQHHRSKSSSETLEMGIKNVEIVDDDTVIQTVEILKNPGQTLGFYIREGNGSDRGEGVFISRIAQGSVVENNGLLRVGDEIVTVNSVDVTRTSLDDVVILMSIPKRLVLTIRTKRNYSKNASCPSLCTIEQDEKPIVVLKKGRSCSATAVEMTEKVPDEFILAGQDARSYYDSNTGRHGNYARVDDMRRAGAGTPKPKAPPPHHQGAGVYKLPVPGDRLYQAADDSGDSGLSSENSGYSAKGGGEGSSTQSQTSTTHHGSYPQIGIIERAVDDLSSLPLDSHVLQVGVDAKSPRLSPRGGTDPMMQFHSPKSGRRGLPPPGAGHIYYPVDYASDSEAMRGGDTYLSPRAYAHQRQYDQNAIRQFQDEIERTHGSYEGYVTAKHKFNKSRSLSPGPESYNSDSEVVYATHATPLRQAAPLHGGVRPQVISRLMDIEDRCNSLPRMDTGDPEELSQWLKKFDTWTTELQGQDEFSSSLPTSTSGEYFLRTSHILLGAIFTSWDLVSWRCTHTHTQTHTHRHTHVHTRTHTRTHIHGQTHTHTCTHTCTQVSWTTHIHIHTQTHTHTNTHTQTHARGNHDNRLCHCTRDSLSTLNTARLEICMA